MQRSLREVRHKKEELHGKVLLFTGGAPSGTLWKKEKIGIDSMEKGD